MSASEDYFRKLGTQAGYIHAMVMLKMEIGRMRYCPIHPRHTRLLALREDRILPLKVIYDRLERDLRRLQGEAG